MKLRELTVLNILMFGIYRYGLALAVVLSHLCEVPVFGWLAVHGFFILSGLLMTLVMQTVYGYTRRGQLNFALNRLVRLYPINLITCAISVIIISVVGIDSAQEFQPQMGLPKSLFDVVTNITMIYPSLFPAQLEVYISPPSWTITVELFFYALIAIGISYNKTITWLWFFISVLYVAFTYITGLDVLWRYSMIMAGSLPFSAGALIFHYRNSAPKSRSVLQSSTALIWLIIAFLMNALFCAVSTDAIEDILFSFTFYMNILINTAIIFNLLNKKKASWEKADRLLGDMSYPIYLLHLPVACALSIGLFNRTERIYDSYSLLLYSLTVLACCIISLILVYGIYRPVRAIFKPSKPSPIRTNSDS